MPSQGYLNSLNPASYSALDSLSFYFNFQARGTFNRFSTSTDAQTQFDSNFDSFSMGFRVMPFWGASVGLYPFSSVGYEISEYKDILGSEQVYPVSYSGEGGLSKVVLGNAFHLGKGLSVGLNLSFIWGSMDVLEASSYSSLGGETITDEKQWYFNNVFMEYGARYQRPFNKGTLFAGVVYSPKSNVYATFNQNIESSTGESFYDEDESADDVFIPQKMGLGLGWETHNGWTFSGDYRSDQWSSVDNSTTLKGELVDNQSYKAGFSFVPQSNKHRFFNGLTYRAGLFYSDGYLKIKNKRIDERGVTLGLTFPIRGMNNALNIAWEYKIAGTQSNGLVKENYQTIKIGLSMIDTWFTKPKFD
jgi:hypothetical protein